MLEILFIFAHQDDEYPVAPRIQYEISRGNTVTCLYLTSGNGYNIDPEVRNRESAEILLKLGVKRENLLFIGSDFQIDDGKLTDSIDKAFNLALQKIKSIDRIYCLAWEGGHHDHDAAHLIALAIAQRKKVLKNTFQFPLYNRLGMPSHLFRVMNPLEKNGRAIKRKLKKEEALKYAFNCLRYKTQWKTWLGLFPEAFFRFAIQRTEILQPVDVERTRERPHRKQLLYEKRFNFTFQTFMNKTKQFRYKNIYN